MRTGQWLMAGSIVVACLGACDHAAPPMAQAVAATAAPPRPAPVVAVSAADANLAIAIARDAAARAAREQTLHVQRLLQENEKARAAAVRQLSSGNQRCIAGQKMRRVGNGWVESGTC